MDISEKYDDTWISSKELIAITGISRATLNNYIRYNIIPKPVVRKPDTINGMTKKIGYYPRYVLDRITKVNEMKREGNSMESIVDALSPEIAVKEANITDNLNLSINDIHSPAYLLNNKFEIEWINNEAEKKIFKRDVSSMRDAADRNIFKLFSKLDMIIENKDQELVKYFMQFVKSRYDKNFISKLYNGISDREIEILEKIYDVLEPSKCDSFRETYLSLIEPGGMKAAYNVYNVVFREGILFIHAPVDHFMQGVMELLAQRAKVINELMKQRMPSLLSFCVLVADLQESSRICAELPPDEYFQLIKDIWKSMDGIFQKYYGTYGKHVGDGMVYYFLKDKDNNYILNSIYCAVELREKLKQLNMEWKIRKNWFNDLYLNIGINEGQEFFGSIPSSANIEFTALGDSVNYAGRLSDLARYGAIWTTKNLINHLDTTDRRKIHFGIRRNDKDREIFIDNMFSRVMDMISSDHPNYPKFRDIATLAVTEITAVSFDDTTAAA
jgi:adenylate cyclase